MNTFSVWKRTKALFIYLAALSISTPFRTTLALSTAVTTNMNTKLSSSSSSPSSMYNVIVIGGGSAGLTAAKLSLTLGKSCALIEADRLGGDCTWTGCVPSKSFLAAAKSMHAAKQYGLVSNEKADLAAIRKKVQANIQQIYDKDDSPEALAKLGYQVVAGKAVLKTSMTVEITTREGCVLELVANEGIIICTGASPRIPNHIKGLRNSNSVTYEDFWDLDALPEKLTVNGGGPIGCELSQAFQRLGSQVTIIAPKLFPREDPAVGKVMEDLFQKEGIKIIKGRLIGVATLCSRGTASRQEHQQHIACCDSGENVTGDLLLVAMGRVPRCSEMGLGAVGVKLTYDQAAIAVNAKLQTTVKGIYAAGDCTGDRQL